MLINLCSEIINPDNITRVTTSSTGNVIYMSGITDATSSLEVNYIEIHQDTVRQVDGSKALEPNKLYMMAMINALSTKEREGGKTEDNLE